MSPQLQGGLWGALIGRLGDALADPAAFSILQDRLARHAAELNGQLPELLLRAPDPEVALRSWLADKDLSHWIPQADGGTAAQGWQFETASWNRSRGAAVMEPWEIGSAHLDGGIDALLAEGMPQAVAIESLEAALLAAGLSLGLWALRHRQQLQSANAQDRLVLLHQGLRAVGLGALTGVGLSLVLSVALAMVPGGQVWLAGLTVAGLLRFLPASRRDPFDLSAYAGRLATAG